MLNPLYIVIRIDSAAFNTHDEVISGSFFGLANIMTDPATA